MKECVDLGLLKKRIHTGMNIIEVMQTIMDLPVADVVEARRGKWVKKNSNPLDGEFSCSACGREFDFCDGDITPIDFGWFFCPNCGAKMTEDRHEQKE